MFVYPFKRSRPFLLRPPYRYVTILHALIKLLISVSYPASKGYFSGLNALLLLVRMKHRIRGHLKHGAAVKLNAGVLVVVALLHSVSARAGCNGTTFAKVDLLQLVRAQERARVVHSPLAFVHVHSVTHRN